MKNLFGAATDDEERQFIKDYGELPMDDHDTLIAAFLEYCYWNDKFERYHQKKTGTFAKRLLLEIERLIRVRKHNITNELHKHNVYVCPECKTAETHRNFELWHSEGTCAFNGKVQLAKRQRR